jgi:hypothetical protein
VVDLFQRHFRGEGSAVSGNEFQVPVAFQTDSQLKTPAFIEGHRLDGKNVP